MQPVESESDRSHRTWSWVFERYARDWSPTKIAEPLSYGLLWGPALRDALHFVNGFIRAEFLDLADDLPERVEGLPSPEARKLVLDAIRKKAAAISQRFQGFAAARASLSTNKQSIAAQYLEKL